MTVQVSLCRTWSGTTLFVFPRGGSNKLLLEQYRTSRMFFRMVNIASLVKSLKYRIYYLMIVEMLSDIYVHVMIMFGEISLTAFTGSVQVSFVWFVYAYP